MGNEGRLYGCPRCCVFTHVASSDGENMRVCLDHSWREGERAKGEAKLVRFSFANLLSVSRICLKVFIEFWICNKNCINTCNEKTSLCFIIFASLKAAPWLLPDTTEGGGESPELVLEQISQKDASVFCSPPCLHPSPTTTAATLLTSPPEQTDSAPCHSWYYLSGKWGAPLFFFFC